MTEAFKSWCIVELMGHVTLAGYVTETEIGGGKLMRIDVPQSKNMQAFTSFFGASSVYKMTPVDEHTVRALCEGQQQQPFSAWSLQQAFSDWAKAREITRQLDALPHEGTGEDPADDGEDPCDACGGVGEHDEWCPHGP